MDSPGLFDTQQSEASIAKIIVQAVTKLQPGPHVFLFVIKGGRYTQEDNGVYSRLKALLDDRIKDYMIIAFTHAEEFEHSQLEMLIQEGPEELKKLMADCNNRFAIFNNKASIDDKQSQVNHFINVVKQMNAKNNNQPYKCPDYAFIEEEIEAETKKRLGDVQKKEMELNEYFKRREEEFNRKDKELEKLRVQLLKKQRQVEAQASTEKEKMQREIESLKQQLKEMQETHSEDDKNVEKIQSLTQHLNILQKNMQQKEVSEEHTLLEVTKNDCELQEQRDEAIKQMDILKKRMEQVEKELEEAKQVAGANQRPSDSIQRTDVMNMATESGLGTRGTRPQVTPGSFQATPSYQPPVSSQATSSYQMPGSSQATPMYQPPGSSQATPSNQTPGSHQAIGANGQSMKVLREYENLKREKEQFELERKKLNEKIQEMQKEAELNRRQWQQWQENHTTPQNATGNNDQELNDLKKQIAQLRQHIDSMSNNQTNQPTIQPNNQNNQPNIHSNNQSYSNSPRVQNKSSVCNII